jgi:adenine phosphoribosyltransferase
MQFYEMQIAGLTRRLPLCSIGNGLQIAAFVLFGDVEVTVACAEELLKLAPEFDVLITNEAKGIPLAYEMARQSGKPYCVARKVKKLYMPDSITVEVKSITTVAKQTLSIGSNEVNTIKGKRILLVDDVVSTGGSLHALEELVELAGGNIIGCAAVLSEGSASDWDGLICLGHLPLFNEEGQPI